MLIISMSFHITHQDVAPCIFSDDPSFQQLQERVDGSASLHHRLPPVCWLYSQDLHLVPGDRGYDHGADLRRVHRHERTHSLTDALLLERKT